MSVRTLGPEDEEMREVFASIVADCLAEHGGAVALDEKFLDFYGWSEEYMASIAAERGWGFEMRDGRPTFRAAVQ